MSVNDSGLLFFPSTQQLQVKWQHHGTFRRFVLEYQAGRAFEALVQKCSQIVPTNDYDLVWFDQEGDPIRIESECDMEVAIREKQGNLLRIHSVKKETPPPAANNQANNEGVLHPGIQCDLCDKYVIGTRFKCLLCADYDLCQKCETTGEHKHHAMLRIVDPNYTIVPWGGRLRGRPGYCPVQGFGRRGRGPFHQSGLFAEHRRNESEARDKMEQAQEKMDETRKKFEEKREELLKQFHSEEWKKTYKTGLDFLNGVGQQIQQALANFGIDATIESMDIRPPKEEEKKEDKAPEQPMETETPPQPQPEPKGSNVELVEPAQNPPQAAPLHPFSFRPAPPPNTENNFTLLDYLTRPTVPSAPAIPMPAPLPVPHAIPMPAPMPYPHAIPMPPPRMAPPIMGGGIHLHHPSMASHPAPQQAAQQPMPQEPLPTEVHVTATLHGNNPSAQSAPSAPTTSISAPVITDAPRITETMIRDWVLGDVYPRVNPNDNNNANMPPLNELQKGIYQQLMRMGFDDHRRAYQAARLNPEDINAAIDCFFNMKLD